VHCRGRKFCQRCVYLRGTQGEEGRLVRNLAADCEGIRRMLGDRTAEYCLLKLMEQRDCVIERCYSPCVLNA